MSRLVVVSNRVPSLAQAKAEAGGLAVGLEAALRRRGGLWFGSSGQIDEQGADTRTVRQHHPFGLVTTDLSRREHEEYYLGFANSVLWPALHGRSGLMHYRRADYATYASVNARWARHVHELAQAGDIIWVHDYHLMLLGRELRALGSSGPLGFFLHTPFPSSDAMAIVPCHRDLVGALTHFDLVGFQSHNDLANFNDYVVRHLGGKVQADGIVHALGQRFRTGVFPIGIDVARLRALASSGPETLGRMFEPWLRGQTGVIGVDRLDYTKGLVHRLQAFETLLQTRPDMIRRTVLLQIAAPSREAIDDYKQLRAELQSIAGRMNSRYGDLGWTPVHYFNRSFSQAKLALLYRHCRVGLVTPLRDGMNLVAKEYVAAQDPENPGVLILSCFAGAAERLQSALIVNPFDIEGVAEALARAIEMPMQERQDRWRAAMTEIEENDIHAWCRAFLLSLSRSRMRRPATDLPDAAAQ